jgi:thiol-disulfide isomerase/thioredoxin
MKRRTVLGAALTAGVAALGVAGGVAWQRAGERRLEAESGGLWAMRFPQPSGGELVMASLRGRPLLLNFWATWCPPCVKEMPEIDRFQRDHPGVRALGLAVDNAPPVQAFLAKTPVSYAIALAGFGGSQLSRDLGNTAGALPFTVLFAADGRVAQRKLGETTYAELAVWAKALDSSI